MNKLITKTGLGIALGLVAFATTALADALPSGRFQIPFQFQVGETVLPAGDYTVKIDSLTNRIELASWNGSAGILLTGHTLSRDLASVRTGKLVFHKCGNARVLREMWRNGASYGHQLPASRLEREQATVEIASVIGR